MNGGRTEDERRTIEDLSRNDREPIEERSKNDTLLFPADLLVLLQFLVIVMMFLGLLMPAKIHLRHLREPLMSVFVPHRAHFNITHSAKYINKLSKHEFP